MPRTVGGKVRAEIELEDGETVTWSKNASRHGDYMTTGGKLFITDRRLLWTPNWYFESLGVDTIELPLAELATAEVEEAEFKGVFATLVTGFADDRLRVEDSDGNVELWTISTPSEATERIRAAMAEE